MSCIGMAWNPDELRLRICNLQDLNISIPNWEATASEVQHTKLHNVTQYNNAMITNVCVCVPFFPGHPTACPKSLSPDLAKDCKRQPTLYVCVYFECDVMI